MSLEGVSELANKYALRVEVASHSDPSKVYVVTKTHEGKWACSCPAHIFRYRKQGKDCKHIEEVKNEDN